MVTLFNDRSGELEARFEGGAQTILRPLRQSRPPPFLPDLMLLFAPLKRQAMDLILILQKTTKLSARRLQPVPTMRSNTVLVSAVHAEAIVTEAAEAGGGADRLTRPSPP